MSQPGAAGQAASACPCGRTHGQGPKARPLAYAACCQPWHISLSASQPVGQGAPDAETLMRSRYSAFVLGLVDYLLATWHASTRPAELVLEPGVKWLGLDVRRHQRQDDTHATVEFVARSRMGGQGQRLHEVSRFVKDNGHWLYVDGNLL